MSLTVLEALIDWITANKFGRLTYKKGNNLQLKYFCVLYMS